MKINKDLRAGFMKEALSDGEIKSLKTIGVIAENWWAVTHDETQMPFAIFQNEEHAKAYKHQFSRTSIVEPWPMIVKDVRKGLLKRRAKEAHT